MGDPRTAALALVSAEQQLDTRRSSEAPADRAPDVPHEHAADAPAGAGVPGHEDEALPIVLQVGGRHADSIRRFTEGVLGWQPVDAEPGGPVPAAAHLVDVVGASSGPAAAPGRERRIPTVLLIGAGDDPRRVADAVRCLAPDAIVGWPEDRDALASTVAELRAGPVEAAGRRQLRIGGAGGGVGTTTVALALGGLGGWAGARTLVVTRPDGLLDGLRSVAPDACLAADLWLGATELPGVPRLRAVACPAPPRTIAPDDAHLDLLVVDAGVDDDVDVLVTRADGLARRKVASTTASTIVVVGDGLVPHRHLAEAAAGRRVLGLPWSARVARAGLHGRVPAALPGTYLRQLTGLVGELLRRPGGPDLVAAAAG